MPRGFLLGRGCLLALLLATSACATLPGLKEAQRGDYEGLRQATKSHEYSPGQVRKLSRAVLTTEIRTAEDRRDRSFIEQLTPCALSVEGALRERGRRDDGVAANAKMVLLEAGALGHSTRRYAGAEDGAFRALAARKALKKDDDRRRYFTDDDERVRRAALLAAREAKDPEDVAELLQVARLDPDPLSRSRALGALGQLGGTEVVLALDDRFETASEEIRLGIVEAWGASRLYDQGGRKRLQRLIGRANGLPSVTAAARLARDPKGEVSAPARVRLVRFAKDGTQDEKRLALQTMPLDSKETSAALLAATADDSADVTVIAWARLLGHEKHQTDAEKALLSLSRDDSQVRFQARAALSAFGSKRIEPELAKQARSKDPRTRKIAATGLVRLGAFDELPRLLADRKRQVRREVACQILARPLLEAPPADAASDTETY